VNVWIIYGVAQHGAAWRGAAWRGVAWRGVAWRGVVTYFTVDSLTPGFRRKRPFFQCRDTVCSSIMPRFAVKRRVVLGPPRWDTRPRRRLVESEHLMLVLRDPSAFSMRRSFTMSAMKLMATSLPSRLPLLGGGWWVVGGGL
jgi:hypothetical protein